MLYSVRWRMPATIKTIGFSKSFNAKLKKTSDRKPPLKRIRIVWGLLALTLAGCEPVVEFLPPFLRQDTPAQTSSTPATAAQSAEIAQMEAAIRQQINEIRQERDRTSLEHNERLAAVARKYSRQMAEENFFSHVDPKGITPAQRVRAGGIIYVMVGENLFKGTNLPQPVEYAVGGWMDSPGHRDNLLQPDYRETGVGIWRQGNTYYMTQLFLRGFSL